MSYLNQKTIKSPIKLEGVGLHSGKNVKICIKPLDPNTGIIFKRIDLSSNNIIYPNFTNVTNTSLNTTISNEYGVKVSTIEHLMGAMFGMGIDNALIEIDNEEVPILDGSAKEFVKNLTKSGIKFSETPIKIIKILKKIDYKDDHRFISIEPSKLILTVDFELKYQNSIIGNQKNKVKIYEDDLTDIYNSRTFCLYEDIEKLKGMGLGKGGTLQNALVVKENEIMNEVGLRNKKEFVNHKILDCMGDLYLAGYKIIGKLICSQGGHKLTNQLLRKVFENKENYSLLEIKEKSLPHTIVNKKHLRSIA